jgi:hypothetical protein
MISRVMATELCVRQTMSYREIFGMLGCRSLEVLFCSVSKRAPQCMSVQIGKRALVPPRRITVEDGSRKSASPKVTARLLPSRIVPFDQDPRPRDLHAFF